MDISDGCNAGTRVKMSKGYKGVEGVITSKTNSEFEFYVIALDNGLNVIAGPSAFQVVEQRKDPT